MISEQHKFYVHGIELTGIIEKPDSKADSVVIVLHPNPLYGGDMFNPVVETLSRTFLEAGYAILRFDFRGVMNRSDYEGIPGAVDDVTAAAALLEQEGLSLAGIAGYSFGGSTALRYCSTNRVDFVVSVSSSLDLFQEGGYPPTHLSRITFPVLMLHGTSDLTVPFRNMEQISSNIQGVVNCVAIENEGHFYHGSLGKVHDEVLLFIKHL